MKLSFYNIPFVHGRKIIIYNVASNNILVLNPELYTSLEQNENNISAFKNAHPELFSAMQEKGLIVEDKQDEYRNLIDKWQQEDTSSDKFTIIINPTMDCNLRCWYCYEKHCIASRMSIDTISSVKKLLEKKIDNGLKNLNISFFGGEPLLYFQETVVPILRFAKEKCHTHNITLHIGFTTNGVLLNENIIEELKCYESIDLQITLDGDREKHDMTRCTQRGEPTYQKIIENIKKGIIAGFHIMVRMNYTQENALSFINVIKEFRDLPKTKKKFLSFSFHKVWQETSQKKTENIITETRENFQEEGFYVHLPVEENEMRCYADRENQIVINYNGDLYKCTARDFTPVNKEGILSNEGELLWNEIYYKRMSLKSGNEACRHCILFPICHGGCTQEKLETNPTNGCRKGYSEEKKMEIIGKRLSKLILAIGKYQPKRKLLHLLLNIFLICTGQAAAQNFSGSGVGSVVDAFTGEFIPEAKIEVLTPDGSLLMTAASLQAPGNIANQKRNVYFEFEDVKYHRLILRFSKDGYDTATQELILKGKRSYTWTFPDAKLKKIRKKNPYELGEAVVRQTKIRMVMKGDTIVYNADAFQMAEGSMLDALIRQLPGVELKPGGLITVNGRFVSNLLVNGEEFFKGDPKVALDNLPAYMVNTVKVYEKEPEYAYITGRDSTQELPLVVDVNLKRQYSIGWIANAEGGYGTHDRFLGRLFGLRFSDHSRLALFGNTNNTNDTREPGMSGNWQGAGSSAGLTTRHMGGAMLLLTDKERKWKFDGNLKVTRDETDDRQETASSTILPGGSTFTRRRSFSESNATIVQSNHSLQLKLPELHLTVRPDLYYAKRDGLSRQWQAELSELPAETYRMAVLDSLFSGNASQQLLRTLINRNKNENLNRSRNWQAGGSAQIYYKIPYTPDFLMLNFNGRYHDARSRNFSHYDLHYGRQAGGEDVFQNRYSNAPDKGHEMNFQAQYGYSCNGWSIWPKYSFHHSRSTGSYSLYRLEEYERWDDTNLPLGILPSTTDSLQRVIDPRNSEDRSLGTTKHLVGADIMKSFRISGRYFSIVLNPLVRFERNKLEYKRANIDTVSTRKTTAFEPSVAFTADDFELRYTFTSSEPSMISLLPTLDDSNPLLLYSGNPTLRNTLRHSVKLRRSFKKKERQRNVSIQGYYNLVRRAVAQAMTYDRVTGVRHYRPENINGNWNLGGSFSLSQAADKKQRLFLSTHTNLSFRNSADYLSVAGEDHSRRSSVRNLSLGEKFSMNCRLDGGYFFSGTASANWQYARSDRPDFSTISSINYNYGVTAQIPLPWKMQFSTDVTIYSRRGYEETSMNTDDIVWNARLSKSILNGNLTFIADGFDLLRQLSSITRTVNAQGRVETWRNTVPSYFMAHVVYRLNKQPKKKE